MPTQFTLQDCKVSKKNNLVAITTPIPAKDGSVSKKTPVYHLPVYKVKLKLSDEQMLEFYCDLADMTDLIDKLKRFSILLLNK